MRCGVSYPIVPRFLPNRHCGFLRTALPLCAVHQRMEVHNVTTYQQWRRGSGFFRSPSCGVHVNRGAGGMRPWAASAEKVFL